MTIATASLSKLSPKMIVNSFGSTLYVLNIAITVTGSVADKVAPSCRAVGNDKADSDSRLILVHSHTSSPMTKAEMKVPPKANVRILHILRKKFALISQRLSQELYLM